MNDLERRIASAAGRTPVDLLIRGAHVADVFTGRIMDVDVAVDNGIFVGFGSRPAREEYDARGLYMLPGLIDAHIHIESSMLSPARFTELVLPHGTTSVMADPHELINVAGTAGLRYFLACAATLPINLFIAMPSCVPAAPFEDAGATLTAADMEPFMDDPAVASIGEMMNFPGVIAADPEVLAKIRTGLVHNRPINGHAPGVSGSALDAYMVTGINNTHEAGTLQEMEAVLSRGGYVFLREGSAAKDLHTLLPGVTSENARRCAFCCDDRHVHELLEQGHIDHLLRLAVRAGLPPLRAIAMATLNAAEALQIKGKGGIAPGWDADFILVDDLQHFRVQQTYVKGRMVAANNTMTVHAAAPDASAIRGAMHVAPLAADVFTVRAPSGRARVIRLTGGSIVTGNEVHTVHTCHDGRVLPENNPDLTLLSVIERHHGTGKTATALLAGYGVKGGAVATTIAHDSHNIVVAGDNEASMRTAVEELIRMEGGCVLVQGRQVLGRLTLPLGGLMTEEEPAFVNARLNELIHQAHTCLAVPENVDPFMSLSFMALPVIPSLKLTARGLFDVDAFRFTSVDADN